MLCQTGRGLAVRGTRPCGAELGGSLPLVAHEWTGGWPEHESSRWSRSLLTALADRLQIQAMGRMAKAMVHPASPRIEPRSSSGGCG